jgi:hypothetical protein
MEPYARASAIVFDEINSSRLQRPLQLCTRFI